MFTCVATHKYSVVHVHASMTNTAKMVMMMRSYVCQNRLSSSGEHRRDFAVRQPNKLIFHVCPDVCTQVSIHRRRHAAIRTRVSTHANMPDRLRTQAVPSRRPTNDPQILLPFNLARAQLPARNSVRSALCQDTERAAASYSFKQTSQLAPQSATSTHEVAALCDKKHGRQGPLYGIQKLVVGEVASSRRSIATRKKGWRHALKRLAQEVHKAGGRAGGESGSEGREALRRNSRTTGETRAQQET
mmetsp:Transcript_35013/g.77062  ORF Transcript_35013/g.77062 Transcript_35013/m.77062 type:complete len:245 (-) Transcript_35013:1365-2099(-)